MRPFSQTGRRIGHRRTPGCATFVLSAPGVRLTDGSSFAEKPLQWPRRRLQRLKVSLSRKIRILLDLGNVLAALPWERSVIARAVWAWVMSAGTSPAFAPP